MWHSEVKIEDNGTFNEVDTQRLSKHHSSNGPERHFAMRRDCRCGRKWWQSTVSVSDVTENEPRGFSIKTMACGKYECNSQQLREAQLMWM
jgi:hypothetical protein